MFNQLRSFLSDESGVTAIEYALIAALVSVAAVTAFTGLGTKLTSMFNGISGKLVVPS